MLSRLRRVGKVEKIALTSPTGLIGILVMNVTSSFRITGTLWWLWVTKAVEVRITDFT